MPDVAPHPLPPPLTAPRLPDGAPRADAPACPDALLRDVVALASDAILITDAEQRLVYVNAGAEATFGYAADEVLGRPLDVLLPARYAARHRTEHVPAFAASGVRSRAMADRREVCGRRKDGEEFPAEVTIARSTAGGGVHYFAVLRDVSRRTRRQAALRESEARYRTLVNSAHDGIFVCDASDRITFANPAFAVMCGRPARELLGMGVADLVAPEDLAAAPLRRAALYAVGGALRSERVLRRPDGARVHVEVGTTLLDGAQVQCVVHDVTERRRMEARLRESEATFRSAFEHAGIGMALVDLDGRWRRVNRALCEIVGYDEAELLARTFQDLTHPDDLEAGLALRREAIAGERTAFQIEKRYLHKAGHVVWATVNVSVVRDDAGAPQFCIAQVQDVTARKAGEAALARQAEELARSNAELEQFAYVASHDLQEPLRAVASYTQLLAERYAGRLDGRADKYIRYAVEGAERMRALIDDLLALSRVGTRGAPFAPVDLSAVVARTVGLFGPAIAAAGAEVTCGPLPTVRGDAGQLGQVVQNLLGNALKFRRADRAPRVRVSAAARGSGARGEWVVTVEDNGIGVDPRFAERIFVLFQRLHTREEYPGTGIGLALCKKIVERHEGRIWVDAAPGCGAAFRFTLPRRIDGGGPPDAAARRGGAAGPGRGA